MNTLVSDILVIGAGAAGLQAATECASRGLQVTVLDKGVIGNDCATVSAKGLGAVGRWSPPGDSPDVHIEDTLKSGCYINDPALVEMMARRAESVLMDLESRGMPFDRNPDGSWNVHGTTAGHRYPRNIGFSDITGKMFIDTLVADARRRRVQMLRDYLVVSLLAGPDGVMGALALDVTGGEFAVFRAKAIVIATGGIGQLYPLTSNCLQNTGDGIALALRAGISGRDLEFVQFYPATVVYPLTLRSMNTNSIGLGAQLKNRDRHRFMLDYEPEKLEEVTRDRLAQCIYNEIISGRGTEHRGVYLDATVVPAGVYSTRIPSEWNLCVKAGFDLTRDSLEVAPSAHYYMGGIRIDTSTGTSIPGLFACGECSAGVNGANRLANNSLTEVVVMGKVAGETAGKYARENGFAGFDARSAEEPYDWVSRHLSAPASAPWIREAREAIRSAMWEGVGITRTAAGIEDARKRLSELRHAAAGGFRLGSRGSQTSEGYRATRGGAGAHASRANPGRMNKDLVLAIETDFMLTVASAIAEAAAVRTESRGAHYRSDFPKQDPSWTRNIDVVWRSRCPGSGDGEFVTTTGPVLSAGTGGGRA